MLRKLYRLGLELNYRWCMANAYITQHYAPMTALQWEREADMVRLDLWRMDRGFL